jgi:hypothetical protein
MDFHKKVMRNPADLGTLLFPRRGPAQTMPYAFHMISFMLSTNLERLLLDSKEVLSM